MTGSEHMLHVGGKVSALSSFSLEEQNEIEKSPQRWCGGSEAQRTPLWSWDNASEHTQHSTDAIPAWRSTRRAESELRVLGLDQQRRDGLTHEQNRHGTWHMVQGKQRSGECTGA